MSFKWNEAGPTPLGNRNWICCSLSKNGSVMLACESGFDGRVFLSSDSGKTWTEKPVPAGGGFHNYWSGCSVSGDGVTLFVCNSDRSEDDGGLYTSVDGGTTWTAHDPDSIGVGENVWACCAVDHDGSNLIAADCGTPTTFIGGRLWTSSNGGSAWTERRPGGLNNGYVWLKCATDNDGSNLIVTRYVDLNETPDTLVYTSVDGGANWTQRTPAGAGSHLYYHVASNSDGSILMVVESNKRVWLSVDGGANWTDARPTGNEDKAWTGCCCSSVGSEMLACYSGASGKVYLSKDTGVSWQEEQPKGVATAPWFPLGMSGDVNAAIVCEYNKRLYLGNLAIAGACCLSNLIMFM